MSFRARLLLGPALGVCLIALGVMSACAAENNFAKKGRLPDTSISAANTLTSGDFALTKVKGPHPRIRAKVLRKIPLPDGYHEGLFLNGNDIWVANGREGMIWVFDITKGEHLKDIRPVSTFTEAIIRGGDGKLYLTDWDEKKMYRVHLDDERLVPELDFPLGPAFPAGAVWDGERFLVITWTPSLGPTRFHIVLVGPDGTRLGTVRVDFIDEPAHLAWDGRFLWITSWHTQRVFKVDPRGWTIAGSFKSPVSDATGIVFDGKYFWLTGTAGDLYQLEVS